MVETSSIAAQQGGAGLLRIVGRKGRSRGQGDIFVRGITLAKINRFDRLPLPPSNSCDDICELRWAVETSNLIAQWVCSEL